MISKASELLELFIQEETRKLGTVSMPHMPTLGSAYEEITKQGIDKSFAIPKALNIRMVSGFIEIGGEMLPEQIDCMLVFGDGKRYGITTQYIYDIEDVLCIFEVKKTLSKSDLSDAIRHLAKIRKKFSEYFEYKLINRNSEPDVSIVNSRFSQVTGKAAPEYYLGMHKLPEDERLLYYGLVQEFLAPVSIIHGYDGYKTEKGLRTAFLDIVEDAKIADGIGIGIPSIPSLVTSGEFCLVKGNGFPFLGISQDNKWVPVLSTRYNSAKLILELIWGKISMKFRVSMPYDDGLYIENLAPLLIAEAHRAGDFFGWMYRSIEPSEKYLRRNDDNRWSPVKIGEAEVGAIEMMAFHGGYLELNKDYDDYLNKKYKISISELKENLILTRLFMSEHESIRPTHNETHMITCDDGGGYISNEIVRFNIWCDQNDIEPQYFHLIFT